MNHRIAAILLAALAVPATAAAATPGTDAMEDVQARAFMESLIAQFEAEILAPGPMVDGWNAQGADVEADLAARPGGKAGNYLLEVGKDGDRGVTVFSPESPTSVIPADWTMIAEIGDFHRAGDFDLYAMQLDGPYFAVIRGANEQNGTAWCSSGWVQARLYEDSSVAEGSDLEPAVVEMLFKAFVRRFEDKVICSRHDAETDGYRARYFLPDGRSLPKMDELEEKAVIVPRGDLGELLLKGN